MPIVTRTNLCTNPSFEAGITGWAATGSPPPAIAQSAVWAKSGANSLRITWAAGNAFFPGAVTTVAGLVSGVTYTFSAYVYVPAGNPAVQLIATGSGLLAGSAISTSLANNVITGERLLVTFTATATSHGLGVYPSGVPAAGQLCYLDAVLPEKAPLAGVYFDGDSSGCVWTGTAQLSTSNQLDGPLQITVANDLDNSPPRNRIFVSGAGATTAQIMRTDYDGNVRPVRGGDPYTLTGGQASLYDYEVPYGQNATYTVLPAAGGSAFVTPPQLDPNAPWLIHPGTPALSIPLRGLNRSDKTKPSGVVYHQPLGRSTPQARSDGQRKARQYTLTIRTYTTAERVALEAIVDGVSPLLLQICYAFTTETYWAYLSFGDLHEHEITTRFGDPGRIWTVDVTEVDRPTGGIASQRTFADVLAEAGTFDDLRHLYATFTGLLTGIQGT